jgi:hypothetical protein
VNYAQRHRVNGLLIMAAWAAVTAGIVDTWRGWAISGGIWLFVNVVADIFNHVTEEG